ncbi:polysaccharide pyruvyl transferase family protein [Nocardioides sp. Soil805]|uniref:polysaccharide pyruvyl transferase family protein n=1 Tax=Nocardioides sp. Soil805 TaxID=1736416 RepID=UPI000702648B|nr:polysaccharide pyruvyl transferase family protein [Nocardioides sp. Soil805]KRF35054.1 hypothetical protein ASG94_13055 [Nocardioides sp. Soil805]
MKVLVLWADHHSSNLGVRVLAEGSAALASRMWGRDVEVAFQDFAPGDSGLSFGGSNSVRDLGRASGPLKTRLREFDVVMDTGAGDSFTDIYGLKRLAIMANVHRIARQLGIPIVMAPQTIGPFRTRVGRAIGARSLRGMSGVITRDPESQNYAVSLGRADAQLATDVVFALPRPTGVKSRDVILNVSGLLFEDNTHVDHRAYREAIRALINELQSVGRDVALLAHVLDNPSGDNDVPVARALRQEFGDTVELLIPSDLTQAREWLSTGEVVIGSRMHACLNAISVGTPAIPWAYSRKFEPLLRQLGWDYVQNLHHDNDPVPETVALVQRWRSDPPTERLNQVNERAADILEKVSLSVALDSSPVRDGR